MTIEQQIADKQAQIDELEKERDMVDDLYAKKMWALSVQIAELRRKQDKRK